MDIRLATPADAEQICSIYNYYVLHDTCTFELIPVSDAEMVQRIRTIMDRYPFLVGESEHQILAYAYAARWKERAAYDHTVELSVYVDHEQRSKGLGARIYQHLLNDLKSSEVQTLLAGIALPNESSVALHKSLGFEYSGTLREVGYKFSKWIDVAYYQKRND